MILIYLQHKILDACIDKMLTTVGRNFKCNIEPGQILYGHELTDDHIGLHVQVDFNGISHGVIQAWPGRMLRNTDTKYAIWFHRECYMISKCKKGIIALDDELLILD